MHFDEDKESTEQPFDAAIRSPHTFTGQPLMEAYLIDIDGDGDLDVFVAGLVYRNEITVPNTAPSSPSGLRTTFESTDVTLSWQPGEDDTTPITALTYILSLYHETSGTYSLASLSRDSGERIMLGAGTPRPGTPGPAPRAIQPAYAAGYWPAESTA